MIPVLVIGEKCDGSLFIEAVEFEDGTRRTTHFAASYGQTHLGAYPVNHYVVHFDDDLETPVNLYEQLPRHVWFLDVEPTESADSD